ncbi:unnamed protein product [Mycena citricolor]|uniref:R3H domain-containing protein n=1 Tax=Mycena citricolor TaxID=2018698 RepID=A0AAD2HCE7_9AGAR|nr:unnamed protein product [Mycena citricolor]
MDGPDNVANQRPQNTPATSSAGPAPGVERRPNHRTRTKRPNRNGGGTGGGNGNGNGNEGRPADAPRQGQGQGQGQRRARGGGGGGGNARPPVAGEHQHHDSPSNNWRARDADGPSRRGRAARFNAGLTSDAPSAHARPAPKAKPALASVADDLTSILTAALSTPPYPDCAICFSAIHPAQPTWSCSPSIAIMESGKQQYCWTTFHLKCIRSWAAKSVKDVADAWAARGEPERGGEWRCPGCQARRAPVPKEYRCFCGAQGSPSPGRVSTPHSCASPCSRARSTCAHTCPLLCHPGPCPPCRITTEVRCGCPKGVVLALRCATDEDISCGSICARPLACGNPQHTCKRTCHTDACDVCPELETVRCYCGKEDKVVACGEGSAVFCSRGDESWSGRFSCDGQCERVFDCGIHRCSQPCHPFSGPAARCPRSPELVKSCPCGRRPIGADSSNAFPPRDNCSAPIPTCDSACGKVLSGCGHACTAKCHQGPCPPCSERVSRPCRCGSTVKQLFCGQEHETDILCEKPCAALRACGRHRCGRICCPLASVAVLQQQKNKSKRHRAAAAQEGLGEEVGGLHECDIVCGKVLGCGLHRCEMKDHKGPCAPCLMSSFEELICPCGRTVLEPPIPCGTLIQCSYQCPLPAPPCGHPRTSHLCHSTTQACPPCPFLTTKTCMCGKKEVGNVRCSQERVACGNVCGKLLGCGYHHCERLCHSSEEGCGACTSNCGKPRKLCLPLIHGCTLPCHAPSSCDESSPCSSTITLVCSCGRIRQQVQCGKSSMSAGREGQQLKCTNDCLVAKRNARLADALGITSESREKQAAVTWPDDVLSFGRVNPRFVGVVEKAFADFVNSDKKTQVLPHMPPDRRKFAHDIATVYRMDTQMVDQEPHRSLQLIRRFDTKMPTPLLSAAISVAGPPSSLGKLADLKIAATPSSSGAWRSVAKPPAPIAVPPSAAMARGWASVQSPVSQVHVPRQTPPVVPSAVPAAVDHGGSSLNSPVPDDWEDDS